MKNFRFAVCVLQFAVFSIAAAAGAPDGGEWQDSLRLAEGKEKSRAFFFSHDRLKDALGIFPAKANRRVRSLNSATEWKFNWSKDPASRPIGFQNPSFDVSNWPSIRVPCSWQAFGANGSGGWGTPLYTNIRYPFAANAPRVMDTPPQNFTNYAARNPVGSYRRDFDISKKDLENEIYLKFDGVDSFFYLWVNGQYVGFAKDSRSPAEFDVTPFLHEGSNTVALEVYRYSDGSYLEDQDMFRLSGIFRDTWLLVRPKVRVRDFFVTASPNGAEWIVKTEVAIDNRSGKPVREDVEVTLYDWKTKKEIKGADAETSLRIAAGAEAKTELTFAVRNPKLWSAEEPNCYVAVVELDGREYVSSIFGFRTSEVRNGRYFLNGQKIKLKGANRHESDPMFGHYVPEWRHRQDVEMLKAANCNAVRNSHYPQPDFFYFLCDTEGLYLVDEANVESHGYGYGDESLSHRPEWLPATVDRNLSMLERNKNHPSVIIWSYGNEAGPGENFAAARDAIKSRDTTRPTHYERDNILADMDSNQYPSVEWVQWKASDTTAKKPFYISEYAHNMVNAMGNLKDYQDAIESSDVILGATIWDWVDQGLYKTNSLGKTIIGFGGDWGDIPNDGQFVMNGCVLSDRQVEPGYYEIRHVFQNWSATAGEDGKTVVLKNKNYFIQPQDLSCTWLLLVNGKPTRIQGQWPVADLAPQQTKTVVIPEEVQKEQRKPGQSVSLRVVFSRAGRNVAADQIDLASVSPSLPVPPSEVRPRLRDTPTSLVFSNGKETITFCKKRGTLVDWRDSSGSPRISTPLLLDAFRAPSSNEIPTANTALGEGLRHLVPECKEISPVVDEADSLAFTIVTDWHGARRERLDGFGQSSPSIVDLGATTPRNTFFTTVTRWRISATGAVTAQTEIRPRGKRIELLRLGFSAQFAVSAANPVSYFAAGPFENYRDRMSGAFLGLWETRLADFYTPYARNEDCGNRENCLSVRLGSLTVSTLSSPFVLNVNPYTPTELVNHVHPGELPSSSKCVAGFFAADRGLGGASCGPAPMPRDIIRADKPYRLDLAFIPDGDLLPRSTLPFAFPPDDTPSDDSSLKVVSVSSREPGSGEAEFAVDGDVQTFWHTQYGVTLGKHPHVLVLDAGELKTVRGVGLLARQDGGVNGRIKDCLFEISNDASTWTPLCRATLPDTRDWIELAFPSPAQFRYLRFTAESEQHGREWASLAELILLD